MCHYIPIHMCTLYLLSIIRCSLLMFVVFILEFTALFYAYGHTFFLKIIVYPLAAEMTTLMVSLVRACPKMTSPIKGGGGFAKGWCSSISLSIKMGVKGRVKNLKKWVTSFMNGPLESLKKYYFLKKNLKMI